MVGGHVPDLLHQAGGNAKEGFPGIKGEDLPGIHLEGLQGDGDAVDSILHHPVHWLAIYDGAAPLTLLVSVDDAGPDKCMAATSPFELC